MKISRRESLFISRVTIILLAFMIICGMSQAVFANGTTQQISLSPTTLVKPQGTSFDVTITYDQTGGSQTTGVGFSVHYDSDVLQYNSYSNYLAEGSTQVTPADVEEGDKPDGNADTDRRVGMAWLDTNVTWPTSAMPVTLAMLNFTVKNDATLGDSPLIINVTVPGAGQSTETTDATITVVESPKVTNVTSTAGDGAYKAGSVITATVQFSRPVDVAGGTPQLELATGGGNTLVAFASGSGTDTLTFLYTVANGDTAADLDYTGTTALDANGATIKDKDTLLDAVLTLPAPGNAGSLGDNKDIVVDTTNPTVTVTDPAQDRSVNGFCYGFHGDEDDAGGSGVVKVEVSFDGGDNWDDATLNRKALYDWTYVATLALGPNVATVRSTDAAGNVSDNVDSPTVTYDTDKPFVTGSAINGQPFNPPGPQWVAGGSFQVQIDFNEPMDPAATPYVYYVPAQGSTGTAGQLTGGSWTELNQWTAYTATIPLGPDPDGTFNVEVSDTQDLAGNTITPTTVLTVTVDTEPPVLYPGAPTTGTFVATDTYTVAWCATDTDGSGIASSEIMALPDGPWQEVGGVTGSYVYTATLQTGENSWGVRVTDNVGNTSTISPTSKVTYYPQLAAEWRGNDVSGGTVYVPNIEGESSTVVISGGSGDMEADYEWNLTHGTCSSFTVTPSGDSLVVTVTAGVTGTATLTVRDPIDDEAVVTGTYHVTMTLEATNFMVDGPPATTVGEETLYTAYGATSTVAWEVSDGFTIVPDGDTATVTPAITGDYVVTGTDSGTGMKDFVQTTAYDSVAIENKPTITPTVQSGTPSDEYTAAGGDADYDWTVDGPDGGFDYSSFDKTGDTFSFVPPTIGAFAGLYTIRVTDGNGDWSQFSVWVPIRLVMAEWAKKGGTLVPVAPIAYVDNWYTLWAQGLDTSAHPTISYEQHPISGTDAVTGTLLADNSYFSVDAENPGYAIVTAQDSADIAGNYKDSLRVDVLDKADVTGEVKDWWDLAEKFAPKVHLLDPVTHNSLMPAPISGGVSSDTHTYELTDVPWGTYYIQLYGADTTVPPAYLPWATGELITVNGDTTWNPVMPNVVPVTGSLVMSATLGDDYNGCDEVDYRLTNVTDSNVAQEGTHSGSSSFVLNGLNQGDCYSLGVDGGDNYYPALAKDIDGNTVFTMTANTFVTATLTAREAGVEVWHNTNQTGVRVNVVKTGPAAAWDSYDYSADCNGFSADLVTGGSGTTTDPFYYDWIPGDAEPYKDAAGNDVWDLDFEFDNVVRKNGLPVTYTVQFVEYASEETRLAGRPQDQEDLEGENGAIVAAALGEYEFVAEMGGSFTLSMTDGDGVVRQIPINIPPLPLDLLYLDDYPVAAPNDNLLYTGSLPDVGTDWYNIQAGAETVGPNETLRLKVEYYAFGKDALGTGVSLSLVREDGKVVRYNPIPGKGKKRVATAPVITVPILLNTDSDLFKGLKRLSDAHGKIVIMVSERGDGKAGMHPEVMEFTVTDTGKVLVDLSHLTAVGLGAAGGGGAHSGVDDSDDLGSDCFIRSVSADSSKSLLPVLLGIVLVMALVARRRKNNQGA